MKIYLALISLTILIASCESNPLITAWKTTTGYGAGYGASWLNNVMKIQYSANYVWVSVNSIPAYSIGKWSTSTNATGQNTMYKLPLSPSVASSKTATSTGICGLWLDGVAWFNPWDGYSYNSLGVWNRVAFYWEYSSFDSCYGHPGPNKYMYHTHANPICLYTTANSSYHSPLIGFALDGYPIYGPYGYSSANDSTSSIKLLTPSWYVRSITARTSLYNGTVLSSTYYGPTINSEYPLGSYIEDYAYTAGYGDLDYYNGRYCVTPEYPSGTFAYFVAVDSSLVPTYPYIIGPYYYGTPQTTQTGTVLVTTTTYYSYSSGK